MNATARNSGIRDLVRKSSVLEIVGDMFPVETTEAALGDLAEVENVDGAIVILTPVAPGEDVRIAEATAAVVCNETCAPLAKRTPS